MNPALLNRFQRKFVVDAETGCWRWTAATAKGYGTFWNGQRQIPAHRFSYELKHGPIPGHLPLDHLCRVRSCINPDHLEAVTLKENLLRGESPSAKCARKTHCSKGHPFDVVRSDHSRQCRRCSNERGRISYHKNKGNVRAYHRRAPMEESNN